METTKYEIYRNIYIFNIIHGKNALVKFIKIIVKEKRRQQTLMVNVTRFPS